MYALLDDVRLVEGSAFVAAPYAGLNFVQMGAEVIRFDPPGGGLDYRRMPRDPNTGASLYWHSLNKGKRSICVNIRDRRGRELIQELITQPGPGKGLLLTNFANLSWLDYSLLAERRSDLIKLEILGNRDATTAVDYTVNALTGIPYMTGDDSNPINHVLPAWDLSCGLQAALALLAALNRRHLTGEGAQITLALADVALSSIGHLGWLAEAERCGPRKADGNALYGGFGRDFRTRDNQPFMLVGLTQKQWRNIVRACEIEQAVAELGAVYDTDFADEADLYAHREALAILIERWSAQHTLAEIETCFARHGICWAPFLTTKALLDDPRGPGANPIFSRIDQPGIGPVLVPGATAHFSGMTRQSANPAPRLGEHTEFILAEYLGLSDGAIGKLVDAEIVALPE